MSTRRRIPTRAELRRFLDVVGSSDFIVRRIEIAPDGGLILHSDPAGDAAKLDPLAEWEARRAARPN